MLSLDFFIRYEPAAVIVFAGDSYHARLLSGAFRDTANRGYLFKMGFARGGFTATQAGRLRGKSGRCPRLTIYRSQVREMPA